MLNIKLDNLLGTPINWSDYEEKYSPLKETLQLSEYSLSKEKVAPNLPIEKNFSIRVKVPSFSGYFITKRNKST